MSGEWHLSMDDTCLAQGLVETHTRIPVTITRLIEYGEPKEVDVFEHWTPEHASLAVACELALSRSGCG